jgi:hypothetical protein
VPINAVVLVECWVGHYDALAAAMTWTSTTADGRGIVDISGSVDHNAREIFCQEARPAGHVGQGARWCEVVLKIDDPSIAHVWLSDAIFTEEILWRRRRLQGAPSFCGDLDLASSRCAACAQDRWSSAARREQVARRKAGFKR